MSAREFLQLSYKVLSTFNTLTLHIQFGIAKTEYSLEFAHTTNSSQSNPNPFKPRTNDRNISAQHIPTLLAQHLQAPVLQSQHLNATHRNIAGRNMFRAFGRPVATNLVPRAHVPFGQH